MRANIGIVKNDAKWLDCWKSMFECQPIDHMTDAVLWNIPKFKFVSELSDQVTQSIYSSLANI